MIRFPRQHLADETLARIEIAARRASSRGVTMPELEPDDDQLVDLPANMLPPGRPRDAASAQQDAPSSPAPAAGAGDGMDLPTLEDSGLDPGTVMQGGDAFDALTKGIGNG